GVAAAGNSPVREVICPLGVASAATVMRPSSTVCCPTPATCCTAHEWRSATGTPSETRVVVKAFELPGAVGGFEPDPGVARWQGEPLPALQPVAAAHAGGQQH